jgi:NAD(P)H-flavin reductase
MSSYLALTVVALTQETPDTVTIHLQRPDGQAVPSKPGQFLTLLVPCGPAGSRPELTQQHPRRSPAPVRDGKARNGRPGEQLSA